MLPIPMCKQGLWSSLGLGCGNHPVDVADEDETSNPKSWGWNYGRFAVVENAARHDMEAASLVLDKLHRSCIDPNDRRPSSLR